MPNLLRTTGVGICVAGGFALGTGFQSCSQLPPIIKQAEGPKQKANHLLKSMKAEIKALRETLLNTKNDAQLFQKEKAEALEQLDKMQRNLTKVSEQLNANTGEDAKLLSKMKELQADLLGVNEDLSTARKELVDQKAKNTNLTARTKQLDNPLGRILGNAAMILENIAGETDPRILSLREARQIVAKAKEATVAIEIPRSNGSKPLIASGTIFFTQGRSFLITNYHVLKEKTEFKFITHDKKSHNYGPKTFKKGIFQRFQKNDLVIIELPPEQNFKGLTILRSAKGNSIQVGEGVVAIGAPFRYQQTVTKGIISAKGREIVMPDGNLLTDLLQTDAAINPGSSGGPLVGLEGQEPELLGIIVALRDGASNIGFAISAETLRGCFKECGVNILTPAECIRVVEGAKTTTRGLMSVVSHSPYPNILTYPAIEHLELIKATNPRFIKNEKGNFQIKP